MAVQLNGIGITLPSVGVSLTPTTLQLAWGAQSESLLGGVSIIQTSVAASTAFRHSLYFTDYRNSMYLPIV